MISKTLRRRVNCSVLVAFFITFGLLTAPAFGQSVAGKWKAEWRVLDNGEVDMIYLDLSQTGTRITGTLTSIGHIFPVSGTAKGSHFELFTSKSSTAPRLTGEVSGEERNIMQRNQSLVAV